MSNYNAEKKSETHESYGMIEVNRFTGGSQTYFGSSIKHSGGIKISIHDAEVTRNLNKDWFHHKSMPIIEVELSYNQFAEMLTANMNTMGTPCTIKSKNGKLVDRPEFKSKRLQFEDEFKKDMQDLNNKLDTLLLESKAILHSKKPPTKREKELILHQLEMLQQEIHSNIPFVQSQFNEQIDKTVTEAKGEIEGFYESKIRNLGIEALEDKVRLPEIEENKDEFKKENKI